jgi:Alpha-L-arabinofuranosidase B (ABFB) domain
MNIAYVSCVVLAGAILSTTGCVAADGTEGADTDAAVGESSSAIHAGTLGYSLQPRGGGGGSPVTLACGENSVLVGLTGRSGSAIDRLAAKCASLNPDGSLGSVRVGASAGGSGGSAFDRTCPPGQAVVGFSGRSGERLDQLSLQCASVAGWRGTGQIESSLPVGGGGGGSPFGGSYDTCVSPYVITGVNLRAGSRIDRIQGVCTIIKPGTDDHVDVSPDATSNDVRLWQAKLLGTHNSYSAYDNAGPDHQTKNIGQQLDWGIRVLEIDVVHESGSVSHGGNPLAREHCDSIHSCLQQINAWSDAHPGHTPIVVYVEFSERWSITGMVRTRTVPTYTTIADAYLARVPDRKKITVDDGDRTLDQLRGRIALSIYRKRGDWDPLLPFLSFDGARDGFLSNSKIFIAGKSTTDGDFVGAPSRRSLRFIKADNIPSDASWVETWKGAPVFIAVNVCQHNDCAEESGDRQRMQSVFGGSLANGIMTNEIDDLQAWLGPPQGASVNTVRLGAAVSFQSHNYPDHYIRHLGGLGELTTASSQLDKADASFRVVPGLSDSACSSFRSVNYPGYYLRHAGYRVRLDPYSGDAPYLSDATFCARPGLRSGSDVSFESRNFPGLYIRHQSQHLYLQGGTDDLFRADATFKRVSALR